MSRRLRKLYQIESSIGRRLDHPNIVKIYDAKIEKDYAYIAMELVHGVTLDTFCPINRLLPMHRAIGIVFKCCLALDYAFRQGVVHRDIKPANILVDPEDNPKITDFGLALNLQKDMNRDSTFIMGVGSPAYMSPEQVKNYPLNQKTDLYSLGVVLFQLLTGRLPFRATNQGALIYKIINADTPAICDINPNLPTGLGPILKKAMEKDLYNRYRNGAEFAKDLSTVRYQIYNENDPVQDNERFSTLRRLEIFLEFEDIEIWEILRISVWREIQDKVALIREGEKEHVLGVIIYGFAEVSIEGKSLCRLGPGEIVGEMSFLHPSDPKHAASVVTLEPTLFLEINGPALRLSSDELLERFNKTLITKVLLRARETSKAMSKTGQPAVQARGFAGPMELEPL
jgi:Serine/threonine protein kinase